METTLRLSRPTEAAAKAGKTPAMSSTHNDELIDYEDDDHLDRSSATKISLRTPRARQIRKKSPGGIHTTGFKDLLLRDELMKALVDCGFEHPSDVQQKAIPQAMLGNDILCQAKSGMGKTAVFSIALLHQMQPVRGEVSALVLCHTRELAYQIKNELCRFGKYMPEVRTEVFYGGVSMREDETRLAKNQPNIVVGTPGRIIALLQTHKLSLSHCRFFVVDECDKMFGSLEMRRDVQTVFVQTPREKQVLMLSATLSKDIRPLCKKFMREPLEIYIDAEDKLTLHGMQQYYLSLQEAEKTRKLVDLLNVLEFNQVVVFVRSVRRAKELLRVLEADGQQAVAIHSAMKQEERIGVYRLFKEFEKRILVATDIVGRGIDIEKVNIVFNYDMTDSVDSYLHRVGRAGRFGTKGLALSFISSEEDNLVLGQVQGVFDVKIEVMPGEIEVSSYMNA